MNKCLIALRKLLNDWESMSVDERCECHNLIEQELSTIEEIEESYGFTIPQIREMCLLLIQFEIKDASIMTKKLKALDIIKEKRDDVLLSVIRVSKNAHDYNFRRGINQLTPKEFDLLKEVLKDE